MFIEKTVQLEQVSAGIFKTLTSLTYVSNKAEVIKVPIDYVTDGYSKPTLTQSIVGGRYEDDVRPSTLHDFLCQNRGYFIENKLVKLSFNRVNNLFYEAMISVGIKKRKALLMRIAVEFNPTRFRW